MEARRTITDDRTAQFLSRIEAARNLPTLPQVLLKLIEACRDEEKTIRDIAQIIGGDSALSARILGIVNSPFYRRAEKIVRLDDALFQLGRDAVRSIAISASIHQVFSRVNGQSLFNMKLYWHHALLCAVLARRLAEKASFKAPELAFLSGILHDVGRLVLWVNFPDEYGKVLQAARNQSETLLEGELRMGITHTEVGSWLLTRWGLDAFTADAARYHHEPLERIHNAFPLIKIIYASNLLSDMPESDFSRYKVIRELFGISFTDITEMLSAAREEVRELAEALDIQVDPADPHHQPLDGRDEIREEALAGEVRDVALLQAAMQGLLEAPDRDAILRAARQGIEVLFGTPAILLFLLDRDRELLVLQDNAGSRLPPGQELTIPTGRNESLPVRAMVQNAILGTPERREKGSLTIMDEMLVHILGSEEILCLPLMTQRETVGVFVLGVERASAESLAAQSRLLALYADQVAMSLRLDQMRKAQTRLYQAGRLAASSALARKVAHEVNNPLSIIKNYLKILGMKLGADNTAQDELRIVNEEIDRVALIIRQLTDLTSEKDRVRQAVDVNGLLRDLSTIIEKSFSTASRIRFHLDLDPSLPGLVTDRNGLKQVLINLLKNAIEAMKQGGNLYVRTKCQVTRDLEEMAVKREGKAEQYVEISVRDDGPGIPEAVRQRLFEPYVTTKGEGHSGLGLSVVHSIVKDLGGTIQCESAEGKGTTFVIRFPLNGVTKTT
ncbi:MAG TPA: HDOD domain-containing protein [Syntrophales bacterium]|nr:HDOD domain-containing protein [Syntrophales bacterium]